MEETWESQPWDKSKVYSFRERPYYAKSGWLNQSGQRKMMCESVEEVGEESRWMGSEFRHTKKKKKNMTINVKTFTCL